MALKETILLPPERKSFDLQGGPISHSTIEQVSERNHRLTLKHRIEFDYRHCYMYNEPKSVAWHNLAL